MADNYLEKRYDELFGSGKTTVRVKRIGKSVETMLKEIYGEPVFDRQYEVPFLTLNRIAEVCEQGDKRWQNGFGCTVYYQQEELKQLFSSNGGRDASAFVVISFRGDASLDPIVLGSLIQTLRFKIAEYNLASIVSTDIDRNFSSKDIDFSTIVAVIALGKFLQK
ncbi:MAG: hypothetical protein MJZ76_08080 [Bacteroidales bacterium]|nr:hypothetical protein [Bacteroidales bacterium]